MLLPIVLDSMNSLSKEQLINEIVELNAESKEFGLELTPRNAACILDAKDRSLLHNGRIELGISTSKDIIRSFCSSFFISRE